MIWGSPMARDNRLYISMECESCGDDMFIGPVLTLLERNGLPVIPFDMAAQETFRCDGCSASHHTGDFDVMVEPGENEYPDDYKEDEDGERD
jgi:hypothetical protein